MNWTRLSQKPEAFWTCLCMGILSQSSLKTLPQCHSYYLNFLNYFKLLNGSSISNTSLYSKDSTIPYGSLRDAAGSPQYRQQPGGLALEQLRST